MGNLLNKTRSRNVKEHSQYIDRFASLVAYNKKYGTLHGIERDEVFEYIDYRGDKKSEKVGLLIADLRQEERLGILPMEQIVFLDYLGIDWGKSVEQEI